MHEVGREIDLTDFSSVFDTRRMIRVNSRVKRKIHCVQRYSKKKKKRKEKIFRNYSKDIDGIFSSEREI